MIDERYLLHSLNNALKVLDLLNNKPNLGVAEISRELGIVKTSVFRILYTLKKNNYVDKNSASKYSLSIKFVNFGNTVLNKIDIVSIAKPFLQKLVKKHNETAHLSVMSQDYFTIFLHKEIGYSAIQMTSNIGVKLPAYNTASGKILLSGLPQEELNNFLEKTNLVKYTKYTITDKKILLHKLEEIRKKGYAVDLEETELGLICYAAPIKDISDKTVSAISISGPAFRMKDNKKILIKSIKKTARKISNALGYNK